MSSTQLNLTSVSFGETTQNIISGLQNDLDFHDVTLVCDEYQQIKAHKVVLASFSKFFKNILAKNPHRHPLIYLKGVSLEDLKVIIDFIYRGEATVNKESLEDVLQLSKDLEIRGLVEDHNIIGNIDEQRETEVESSETDIGAELTENEAREMLSIYEPVKSEKNEAKQHIYKTTKERSHPCEKCEYTATNLANLRRHNRIDHIKQQFLCDNCLYITNRNDSLLRHKRSKHNFKDEKCSISQVPYPKLL